MKTRCFIVDIDGTLTNNNHRQLYVRTKPKNWVAFNSLMHRDLPVPPVIDTVNILFNAGIPVILCTGRQERHRPETEKWLKEHGVKYTELLMRPSFNHEDDMDIKERMLIQVEKFYDVIAVFDDRYKVVNRYRKLGYYVFDCQQQREVF